MGKVGRILIFAREIILNIPEWSKLKIQKKKKNTNTNKKLKKKDMVYFY